MRLAPERDYSLRGEGDVLIEVGKMGLNREETTNVGGT